MKIYLKYVTTLGNFEVMTMNVDDMDGQNLVAEKCLVDGIIPISYIVADKMSEEDNEILGMNTTVENYKKFTEKYSIVIVNIDKYMSNLEDEKIIPFIEKDNLPKPYKFEYDLLESIFNGLSDGTLVPINNEGKDQYGYEDIEFLAFKNVKTGKEFSFRNIVKNKTELNSISVLTSLQPSVHEAQKSYVGSICKDSKDLYMQDAYQKFNATDNNLQNNKSESTVAESNNLCAGQPSWAKILTKDGVKTIGNLKVGDLIWSAEGWAKVLNKMNVGIGKVYKYKISTGIFYGTENSRVVSQSSKIMVKDADSIDPLSGPYNQDAKDIVKSFETSRKIFFVSNSISELEDEQANISAIGLLATIDKDNLLMASLAEVYNTKITQRSFISTEEVLNITVDNKNHTYWTNGCHVSDNRFLPLICSNYIQL